MLSHIVVFWLKDELTADQRAAFRNGLETLKGIEAARGVYVGAPAATGDRPVIDKSYSLAVTVLFDSIADHDIYQVHPLHQAFLKQFSTFWSRVAVYDYE
jgi:hypothetical protein